MIRELLKQKTYVKMVAILTTIGFLMVIILGLLWAFNIINTLIPTWIGCGLVVLPMCFLFVWGYFKDNSDSEIKRGN